MNAVDKGRVQAAFSRGAASYDAQARAQMRARARVAALLARHAPGAVRILDVGAGTGALAARLLAERPERRLALVDLAQGMCEAARAACPRAGAVRADAEALPFGAARFDALVSSSTLQWLEQLEPALGEVRRTLAPGGLLVLALFGAGTLRELQESWIAVAGPQASARLHRFFTRDEVARGIVGAGLELVAAEEEEIVERHPDARAVLRAIRAVGAGNAVPRGLDRGLGGRRVTLALLDRYDAVHRGPDGVPATYQVIYAVARRPA